MEFEWLDKFHHGIEKDANYAEKTLAAYRRGMKGKGSIVGVVIESAQNCCDAVRNLPAGQVYHPDQAPHLPLSNFPPGRQGGCVYPPVMTYKEGGKRESPESVASRKRARRVK